LILKYFHCVAPVYAEGDTSQENSGEFITVPAISAGANISKAFAVVNINIKENHMNNRNPGR